MSIKEQITKIKEYANLAWASYAMLQYVDENEITTQQINEENEKKAEEGEILPARWIYADGIKRGYELKEDYKEILRKQGQPTAYALGIEAR